MGSDLTRLEIDDDPCEGAKQHMASTEATSAVGATRPWPELFERQACHLAVGIGDAIATTVADVQHLAISGEAFK